MTGIRIGVTHPLSARPAIFQDFEVHKLGSGRSCRFNAVSDCTAILVSVMTGIVVRCLFGVVCSLAIDSHNIDISKVQHGMNRT